MTIKEETEVIVATGLSVSLPNMAAKRHFRAAPLTPIFREINLRASAGQCLGIVGESGSGKTTLGRTLVRLLRPTSGTLLFQGRDITSLSEPELRPIRDRMQIIFQEPRAALNPRRRVDDAVSQPLLVYGKVLNSREAREHAADLLHQVGLDPILGRRYPRELSGGQLQRVCIARAISVRPALIVADEIVSGLDMSSQAQVLNLLDELRQQLGLCLVFISHDLSVVRSICDQVIVLLDGRTVESGPVAKIFSQPRRRYTQSLIEAVPLPEPDRDWLKATTDTTHQHNRGKAMNIQGSTALVTGANRGIGRELVNALIKSGVKKIYATARDVSGVQDLANADPDRVHILTLDVTNDTSVEQAAASCSDVDILVNNAGINRMSALLAADSIDNARAEMETNYFGTLRMCRAFAPVLKQNGGGCIVNMLSVLSHVALPLMGSLCASKSAGLRLTEGVRAELDADNTLVMAVMPGAVDTDMSRDFPPPKMPAAEVANAILDGITEGQEEIYPGEMASGLRAGLKANPKGVEKELAAYLPG